MFHSSAPFQRLLASLSAVACVLRMELISCWMELIPFPRAKPLGDLGPSSRAHRTPLVKSAAVDTWEMPRKRTCTGVQDDRTFPTLVVPDSRLFVNSQTLVTFKTRGVGGETETERQRWRGRGWFWPGAVCGSQRRSFSGPSLYSPALLCEVARVSARGRDCPKHGRLSRTVKVR